MGRELTRRQALIAVPVVAGVSACTATQQDPPTATTSPSGSPTSSASPAAGGHGTQRRVASVQVVTGADGPATVALSGALFTGATVVVVAADGGTGTIGPAAAAATALGAPLLVASDQLVGELDRLKARMVLCYPTATGLAVGDRTAVDGPASAADLPGLGLPVPLPSPGSTEPPAFAMWTRGAPASEAVRAAVAAAGATVLLVRSSDPRQAPVAAKQLIAGPEVPVVAVGPAFGTTARFASRISTVRTAPQLPGGGWTPFPGRRIVALYGHPGTPSLGALGQQSLPAAIARAKSLAAAHARYTSTPVVPAFEMIATVASGSPGSDHNFSNETPVSTLRPWVEAAGQAGLYVVLDLQSGRSEFLKQAKLYTPLLLNPYVGLALDPEWRLAKKQRPLKQLGSVDVAEVNDVIRWLAALVDVNNLPPKVLTLHQFSTSMIRRRQLLDTSHDEVQVVIHADGQGSRAAKWATWHALRANLPRGVYMGWKNFYHTDSDPLSPQETMTKVHPTPWFISYQ